MRNRKLFSKIIFTSILFLLLFSFTLLALEKDDISQIQQAIQAKGAKWTAGESWVTKLSREEQLKLLGHVFEPPAIEETRIINLPQIENLPEKFDWRDNNGNWVTPVTNQLDCGSCWDFSAVAQVEAWWKIQNGDPNVNIDLSEQFVLSCSGGTCEGWSIFGALEFIKDTGVPLESCMPYQADDKIPCDSACADWQNEAVDIPGWGFVTLDEAIIENIKSAIYLHPLSASYIVYEDFMAYTGGVYEHVWGDVLAGHAILIVGWDDENECWICKNSWGPDWGEKGYFRIKWGDSDIGQYSPFVYDESIVTPSLAIDTVKFNLNLTKGDSLVKNITIHNQGEQTLFYSATDYKVEFHFHVDDFNSYDGSSWWCGDSLIGGYNDHWLDFLITPVMDLTGTASPKLTCMVNWSVESYDAPKAPYDGWDGCNVWISTDGGATFDVLEPTTPAYTCRDLWSFGHPEEGWNYGMGIAGWAGTSNGWVPAEFDLSSYKSDQVVIRFALASDLAYCAIDNNSLQGFFVDEIQVADGGTVIFENHGVDDGTMQRESFGGELPADWISIFNTTGTIAPNSSADLGVIFNTRQLLPGKYGAKIKLITNDVFASYVEIDFDISLSKPEHDLAIKNVSLPGQNIPILMPIKMGAEIANEGVSIESDFDVLIKAMRSGSVVYEDTAHVASLQPGEQKVVKFDPYLFTETGEVEFSVSLLNIRNDYNEYNNNFHSSTNVSNLVDSFEGEAEFWSFEGGWAQTHMAAHSGTQAVHVNGGVVPYPANMNAVMTFLPGFDVRPVDKLTIKFWAKYLSEQDKDIFYVEASGDSVNWKTMYSLSGAGYTAWTQHEVELTEFIEQGAEKIWFRLLFVSDDVNSSIGFLIDDIEVYPCGATDIQQEFTDSMLPDDWALSQNFPNPFNMSTSFRFSMPEPGNVRLTIFNINGEIVRTIINQRHPAGFHTIEWNGRDNKGNTVGSGVYFYKLEIENKFVSTKKMILLK